MSVIYAQTLLVVSRVTNDYKTTGIEFTATNEMQLLYKYYNTALITLKLSRSISNLLQFCSKQNLIQISNFTF